MKSNYGIHAAQHGLHWRPTLYGRGAMRNEKDQHWHNIKNGFLELSKTIIIFTRLHASLFLPKQPCTNASNSNRTFQWKQDEKSIFLVANLIQVRYTSLLDVVQTKTTLNFFKACLFYLLNTSTTKTIAWLYFQSTSDVCIHCYTPINPTT